MIFNGIQKLSVVEPYAYATVAIGKYLPVMEGLGHGEANRKQCAESLSVTILGQRESVVSVNPRVRTEECDPAIFEDIQCDWEAGEAVEVIGHK
jgi:hypothetical protein